MSHKVSWDRDAPAEAVYEAVRRVFARDGIPRHVYSDGRIMKYDWELVTVDELLDSSCHGLEEQDGQQGR